jgi:hypothetical protein
MKTITLTLDTPADLPLVRAAIEDRKDHLAKLAEKVGDGGRYSREAQAIRRDAQRLDQSILPRCAEQQSISPTPPTLEEVLVATIGARVRNQVRSALAKAGAKDMKERFELPDEFERAIGSIADVAAQAIAPLLADVAEEGYDAGRRSLADAPAALARRVVEAQAI